MLPDRALSSPEWSEVSELSSLPLVILPIYTFLARHSRASARSTPRHPCMESLQREAPCLVEI